MTYRLPTFAVLGIGVLALGMGVVFGDDERHGGQSRSRWIQSRALTATMANTTYAKECSACHMAYQPSLLPALAWARIMDPAALASHYGDDASLSGAAINEITAYLTPNAGDQRADPRTQARTAGTPHLSGPEEALPRVTEAAWLKREHDEIPPRLVKDNPGVASLSQCNACHRRAAEGDYSEGQIEIPGVGSWDD